MERDSHVSFDHLPPVEAAPILQNLARDGLQRFRAKEALPTPIDEETGIVDHQKLIALMRELVDPEYQWRAPFFDEHHLHWFARDYNTPLAYTFRELPTNIMWVPRDFHDFIHVVTQPPPVPSEEVMKAEIRSFRRRDYIYRISNEAISIALQFERLERYDNRGDVMYIDGKTKRVTRDLEGLEERRSEFVKRIMTAHNRGLIDLSMLAPMDIVDQEVIEQKLAEIPSIMDGQLTRHKGKAALTVDLPVLKIA